MSNDVSLLPPKNAQKHLDKTMISLPTDFRHLAHIPPPTASEIDNIKNSDDVIGAVNEVREYLRPSSSNGTIRLVGSPKVGVVREYENQPSSHGYENVVRPSRKKYKAPPPPPQETKPTLLLYDESAPVVFRSIPNPASEPEHLPTPTINTAHRIEPPKPNSMIIERPGDLGQFGLDDCIPIAALSSCIGTLSPMHRPIAIQKEETPILTPVENDYMSTIRSTSAQGKQILDDLDSWLDDLDDDEREKLSTISTDESGYPTLVLEKDRAFMNHLVEKYELGVAPETIRLRKKTREPARMPPFSTRPISLPPNRPPPDYSVPSFDAPKLSGNTWDLPALLEKRGGASTMPAGLGSMSVQVLAVAEEVEEEVAPVPKPRTRKLARSPERVVIGEEFEVIEETQTELDSEDEVVVTRF